MHGRTSMGEARDIKIKIPLDMLERIDTAADEAGLPRAEWIRDAAVARLDEME